MHNQVIIETLFCMIGLEDNLAGECNSPTRTLSLRRSKASSRNRSGKKYLDITSNHPQHSPNNKKSNTINNLQKREEYHTYHNDSVVFGICGSVCGRGVKAINPEI